MWRAASGPSPAPSQPDSLCWSEDSRLAFACEDVVRVLSAGEAIPRWRLNAKSVLEAETKKRPRDTATVVEPLYCPSQHGDAAAFVGLSYAPLNLSPDRGCLLCAAVAHACNLYARPEAPLQLNLTPVVSIAPLLHEALNHASPPTEAEREAIHVHRSCWSSIVGTGTELYCLALAGPKLLTIVAHNQEADIDSWHVAANLGGGATAVHFAPSSSSSALHLVAGGLDGAVTLWQLERTGTGPGDGSLLHTTACRRVGSATALPRRVVSIGSALMPSDSEALMLVVAGGPFVVVYRIDLTAATGTDEEAPPIGHVGTEAAHAHEVTSVCCANGLWFSSSHDGSVLHGRLDLAAQSASLAREHANAGKAGMPPQVEGNIPSPLEYPELDSLVEGRPPPSKEQQREVLGVEFVAAPKHTSKDVFGKMAKGNKSRIDDVAASGDGEMGGARAADRRLVFGLAPSPCGGGLAVCLRVAWVGGSRRMVRPENWRLLLALPPPPPAPLKDEDDDEEEAAPDPSSLLMSSLEEGGLWETRPAGGSLWALGDALKAAPANERDELLSRLEARALAARPEDTRLRALQYVRALACGSGGSEAIASRCAKALLRAQAISLHKDAERDPDPEMAVRRKLPTEKCLLSGQSVAGTDDVCSAGHALPRCWKSFRLLPLKAWLCGTCGAGSCEGLDDPPGALGGLSPPGICGLCGSPCHPASARFLCSLD